MDSRAGRPPAKLLILGPGPELDRQIGHLIAVKAAELAASGCPVLQGLPGPLTPGIAGPFYGTCKILKK